MKVPQRRQLTDETPFVADGYNNVNPDANAFGASAANAAANLSKGLNNIASAAIAFKKQNDDIQLLDFANKVNDLRSKILYDKENGYLNKKGEFAAGKTDDVMSAYLTDADNLLKSYNFHGANKLKGANLIKSIGNGLYQNVSAHDLQQTAVRDKNIYENSNTSQINTLLQNRNNPDSITNYLANIKTAADVYSNSQGLDEEAKKQLLQNSQSIGIESLLSNYLADNNLDALQTVYEKYSSLLSPDKQASFKAQITKNDFKNKTVQYAEDIMNKYETEEEQLIEADKIQDIDLRDNVSNRIKAKNTEIRNLKKQKENEAREATYNNFLNKQKNGEIISYDDIVDGLNPIQELSARRYVEQINSKGKVSTSAEVDKYLLEKQLYDAQGFAKLNLDDYKGFISDSDIEKYKKAQAAIIKGDYITDFQNEKVKEAVNKAINDAGIGSLFGSKKGTSAFNIAEAMTHEYEKRYAHKIPAEKRDKIISSLAYEKENKKTFQQIEQEMGRKTGFVKKVINDIAYFEKQRGHFPDDKEIRQIVDSNVKNYNNESRNIAGNQIQQVQYSHDFVTETIDKTIAKPNETKSLTYFADTFLPSLENKYGIKITVVDGGRYRPNAKNTKHNENGVSRAIDISTSEHNEQEKYIIFYESLSNPASVALGTSDPFLLAQFPPSKFSKVIDERDYDRKNGTNHVHHIHVT